MIAFQVLRGAEVVEWQFFSYPMHTPWNGYITPEHPRCAADCSGCLAARRDHDSGDEDGGS